MKIFLGENKVFLSLYLVFAIAGGILIAIFEHGDEILYFSSLHNSFFNEFFKWTTRLAELPVFLLIIITTLLSGFGRGLLLSLNTCFVFAAVQFFKRVLFADQLRPSAFFEGKTHLDFVPGLDVMREHSFPSGHTAAAFACFFMLSILLKDKRWSIIFFFAALLVGVSRVYLLQHFFRDVYFGAMIGVVVTAVFYLTFAQSELYNNLDWKDKRPFPEK